MKKLKDLRVIDILLMPRFEKHIKNCIDQIRRQRIAAVGIEFKRGPLERLQEKKVFNPKDLAALYGGVLDGSLNNQEYPAALRAFIKLLGDVAYHKTILELKQLEKDEKSR